MKAKITSGKAAPKNNWIWTGKLKQQHGSGVGSLVHAAESRQEQTLIHSALTKKIRTKKTSNGPSEADCPCGFQEQKNEVKKDTEIGAGQNGTQQPKTTWEEEKSGDKTLRTDPCAQHEAAAPTKDKDKIFPTKTMKFSCSSWAGKPGRNSETRVVREDRNLDMDTEERAKNSNRRKIFCTETGSGEQEKNAWRELAKNK
jgi:hypothetical protein